LAAALILALHPPNHVFGISLGQTFNSRDWSSTSKSEIEDLLKKTSSFRVVSRMGAEGGLRLCAESHCARLASTLVATPPSAVPLSALSIRLRPRTNFALLRSPP
jgi:hypothetical protein